MRVRKRDSVFILNRRRRWRFFLSCGGRRGRKPNRGFYRNTYVFSSRWVSR